MNLSSSIISALDGGMNLKLLLQATGLDESSFKLKLDDGAWNLEEEKIIKSEIKHWRRGE